MKKLFLLIGVLALSVLVIQNVNAAYSISTVSAPVSAAVDPVQTFSVKIYQGDATGAINWTNTYTTMSFGKLTPVDPTKGYDNLSAKIFFVAAIGVANNTGKAYYITYNGAPLKHTDLVTVIPNDCWVMTIDNLYAKDGITVLPAPGTLNKGKYEARTTNLRVHTSDSVGGGASLAAYFGVVGDPVATVSGTGNNLISPSQKFGSYSANVVFTITEF